MKMNKHTKKIRVLTSFYNARSATYRTTATQKERRTTNYEAAPRLVVCVRPSSLTTVLLLRLDLDLLAEAADRAAHGHRRRGAVWF